MSGYKDDQIRFLKYQIEALKKQNDVLRSQLKEQNDIFPGIHPVEIGKPLDRYPLCKSPISTINP